MCNFLPKLLVCLIQKYVFYMKMILTLDAKGHIILSLNFVSKLKYFVFNVIRYKTVKKSFKKTATFDAKLPSFLAIFLAVRTQKDANFCCNRTVFFFFWDQPLSLQPTVKIT